MTVHDDINDLLEIPGFLRREPGPIKPERKEKRTWIMPKASTKKKTVSKATVKTNKDLREALIGLDYERKVVEALPISKVKDVLYSLAAGKGCTMGAVK